MSANNASAFRKVINAEQYWVGNHRLRAGDVVNSSSVVGATVADALDTISASGVGPVLTLNGQVGQTQTFSTGSTGTDVNVSSAALNHAFNIPTAGLGVTRGLVSNAAQTLYGAKTFDSAPVLTTGTLLAGANTMTFPGSAQTLVGLTTTDALTNKTMTDDTNNVIARGLWVNNGLASVSIYAAGVPVSGQVLTATGAGTTATWQTPAAAGLTSLNAQTGSTQTFAVDTSSVYGDFAVNSSGNVHTFSLPDASQTVRGVVSTGGQTFGGVKTFASAPSLTSNTLTAGTSLMTFPGGSAQTLIGTSSSDTLTNKTATDSTNNITATGIFVSGGTVTTNGGSAPTSGHVLTATSSSNATWQAPTAGLFGGTLVTSGTFDGALSLNPSPGYTVYTLSATTGKVYRIVTWGTYSGNTGSLTLQMTAGTGTQELNTISIASLSNNATNGFYADVVFHCTGTGTLKFIIVDVNTLSVTFANTKYYIYLMN